MIFNGIDATSVPNENDNYHEIKSHESLATYTINPSVNI